LKFLIGVIIGAALLGAALWAYFWFGLAPVAVNARAMPFESTLAMRALHVATDKNAPKNVPVQPDEANLTAGAKAYAEHCAVCHGLPNRPSKMHEAEFPAPPQLFEKDDMVVDDPAGETYWKVANGIRLTGMPSFSRIMQEQEIWQVSLMLAHADKLPPQAIQVLNLAPLPQP
jgi:thiosulfate dehydrogenase